MASPGAPGAPGAACGVQRQAHAAGAGSACTCAGTGIHTGPQPACTLPWAIISSQLPRSPHTTRTRTERYRGGHGGIRPNGYLWPTWPARAGAVAMARRAPGHPHARTSPPFPGLSGLFVSAGVDDGLSALAMAVQNGSQLDKLRDSARYFILQTILRHGPAPPRLVYADS